MSNDKISARQICALTVLEIIGVDFVIIPQLAIGLAWRDGLTVIIIATLAAAAYSAFLINMAEKYQGADFFDCCRNAFGNFPSRLIVWGFIAKTVLFAGFCLRVFAESLTDIMEGDIPLFAVMAAMALCGLYAAYKGREVRGRLAEIFLLPLLGVIAFVLICGVSGGRADELLPVLEESGFNLTKGIIVVLFWFYPLEYILVSMPYIKDRTSLKKKAVSSVLISGVLCALVFTLTLIRFGAPQMRSLTFSVLEMMYSVSLPASFIERQEGLMMGIWTVGVFFTLSAALYNSGICAEESFGINSKAALVICTVVAVFAGLLPENGDRAYYYLVSTVTVMECIYLFVIPIVLFAASILEGRKNEGRNMD